MADEDGEKPADQAPDAKTAVSCEHDCPAPPVFPAPGMIGERHFFFGVAVDPAVRVPPAEDGSPLEREAVIQAGPLHELIDLARRGEIEDSKTELAARRLAEELAAP